MFTGVSSVDKKPHFLRPEKNYFFKKVFAFSGESFPFDNHSHDDQPPESPAGLSQDNPNEITTTLNHIREVV